MLVDRELPRIKKVNFNDLQIAEEVSRASSGIYVVV